MTSTLPRTEAQPTDGERALVAIRPGGSKTPIFCVHAEQGHLRPFENLARHLDQERPVYGLQGILRDRDRGVPYTSFGEMAQGYVGEIREAQAVGPYVIVGECSGCGLAYELAQQLRAGGAAVALLVLIDCHAPGGPHLKRFVPGKLYRFLDDVRMLGFHLRTLTRLSTESRSSYLSTRVKRVLASRAESSRVDAPEGLIRKRGFREAVGTYRPAPYGGRVLLMRGQRLPWGVRPIPHLGWGDLVAELEISELPCYFGTSLLEPAVRQLAAQLAQIVDSWA